MTWNELAEWAKNKELCKQVDIYVEDGEEPDWNAPFVGFTCIHPKIDNGKPSYDLHVNTWEDEHFQTFTWQDLLNWIQTIDNKDDEATSMVAWHKMHIKPIENNLYTYGEI